MPKRFNPFTGTFDFYSGSTFTDDLNDSAGTKIATVVSGEITAVDFGIDFFMLQETGDYLLQENGDKIIL